MIKSASQERVWAVLLAFVFILQCLYFVPIPAQAADNNALTIFLNQQSGNDSNSGTTADKAIKTLDAAIKALASEGGTVVITGQYTVSSDYKEPSHGKPVTLTSLYGGVDYRTSGAALILGSKVIYKMSGEDIFRDININYNGVCVIAACFNPVTIDTGVVTKNTASASNQLYLLGGYEAPEANLPANLDSHVTIKSGTFFSVAGFSRTRGTGGTYDHTGTAYIDISGGAIENLFGANLYNHFAKAAVITVTGGKINKLCVGGDVTRRIETAKVYLYGGTIGTVDVNNIIGNGYVYLYGTAVTSSLAIRYQDYIADQAKDFGGKKYLSYNGLLYTAAQINSFVRTFDFAENISVLYVKDGATGDGLSLSNPTGSFEEAMNALSKNGGTLTVVDKATVPASFKEINHTAKITIVGNSAAAQLAFPVNAVYSTTGETVFDGITLTHAGKLSFVSKDKLTFTGNIRTGGSGISINGKELYLSGGSFDLVTGGNVTVNGAEIAALYCTEGADIENATVDIVSGKVDSLVSAKDGKITGSLILRMGGGTVSSLAFNNIDGAITANFSGGTLGAVSTSGCGETALSRTLHYGNGFTESTFSPVSSLFDEIESNEAVYVADKGTGNGKSPASPFGSLIDAVKALPQGGTVVICGPVTISNVCTLPEHSGIITVTSSFAGTDYRSSGAVLEMSSSIVCGGDTVFENFNINCGAKESNFYGSGHALTMGDGLEVSLISGNTVYPSICGGARGKDWIANASVTVNSGTWNSLRAGSNYSATLVGVDYKVTVNGGLFNGPVAAAGVGFISGDASLTINGGTFYKSVYAFHSTDYGTFTGSLKITFNDGLIYGKLAASNLQANALNGTYDLYITGGNLAHVTDIVGAEDFIGTMTSAVHAADNVDINAPTEGTYSFTNYLRNAADPCIFTDGKYYYFTSTHGTRVALLKVANLGDIAYAEPVPIYTPAPGKVYSLNMWSPEIHYMSEETVGKEYAGWYLYLCSNDGTEAARRMYVVKCLTDDLLGPWGNPITGEVNVPLSIVGKDDPTLNTGMAGGMSPFVYNGQLYTTWVGSMNQWEPDYVQVIYINKMENPWTLLGQRVELCRSEYEWELHGYGVQAETGHYYPKVVECVSAVIDDENNLYLIYSASGVWTIWYSLGQLKFLGGEVCDAANWIKTSKTPIFTKSNEVNGCGHGFYFRDLEGQRWVTYHAYTGTTTESGRFAFLERYSFNENGFVIGNGSGHPAPMDTVYTLNVNSMPIAEKISGFATVNGSAPDNEEPQPGETTGETPDSGSDSGSAALYIIIAAACLVVVTISIFIAVSLKKKRAK